MMRIILSGCILCLLMTACNGQDDQAPNPDSPMTKPSSSPAHTNHLAQEKSPYLLQHVHNPVDWYPWGEAAFQRAREENKPIFLSVGYSTCHWCHVMERESFEDEAVGEFLNEHFISIKVDREERPDVDKIYMTFVQASTGSGGWPMTVFLTPELKPFYGGTYFPPEPRHGRPSFMQLLKQISQMWQEREDELKNSANQLNERLAQSLATKPSTTSGDFDADLIRRAGQGLKDMYDPRHGGFGSAPKFPQPSQPELLLRYAQRFGDKEAEEMVLETCRQMAAGGIYDQLGGGFSRYSVDQEWLVPHFEKMLYDNAQLLDLYLNAYLLSGDEQFAQTARGIITYLLRDMTHADGGFYSAEDADSEGHEGKFYCWTRDDLQSLLTPEELEVAIDYFGITKRGNFTDHSHPTPLPNQNVLSIVNPDLSEAEIELLNSAKSKMFEERSKRVRPHLDDKVLASWNGLMLGALARASAVLEDETYLTAAERNFQFLRDRLWDPETKTLHHRWRDGEQDSVQLLEDYALLLEGVLHLYEVTLNPMYLEFSIELAESMVSRFYDSDNGGFWQAAGNDPSLLFRIKEDYDGAEPSGNSVAVQALLRLATVTEREAFQEAAEQSLAFFHERIQRAPQSLPRMLQAVDYSMQDPYRVVIAGDRSQPETQALSRAAQSVYQPHKVVMGNEGPIEPFAKTLPATNGPVVYLCTGTSCQPPTSDVKRVPEMLK